MYIAWQMLSICAYQPEIFESFSIRGVSMAAKRSVGLRLSEATIRELEALSKKYNVSQADVVAVLVRCVYQNGNIDDEELDEMFEVVSRC